MKIFNLLMMACLLITSISTKNYAQNNAQNNTQNSDSTKTLTIKVKGVTCSGDLKTIAGNVEKLAGVRQCKTGKMGATSTFEVSYNPTKVNLKDIHNAIEGTSGCENPNDRPYKVK
jgi:copper chaperone CopZ